MFKLFTVDQAMRLLPVIEGHVASLQGASRDANDIKARLTEFGQRQPAERTNSQVEIQNLMRELEFLAGQAKSAKVELDRLGVELTDVEHGAVAIPSSLCGEVVALTWEPGQAAITHYRRLAGDRAPRPLPSDALGGLGSAA